MSTCSKFGQTGGQIYLCWVVWLSRISKRKSNVLSHRTGLAWVLDSDRTSLVPQQISVSCQRLISARLLNECVRKLCQDLPSPCFCHNKQTGNDNSLVDDKSIYKQRLKLRGSARTQQSRGSRSFDPCAAHMHPEHCFGVDFSQLASALPSCSSTCFRSHCFRRCVFQRLWVKSNLTKRVP